MLRKNLYVFIKVIIPILDLIKGNKELNRKIEEEEVEFPQNLEEIDYKSIEEDYKNTIDIKNRFEDKAKTIVAALTIAITLILNLSSIIDKVLLKFNNQYIDIIIFIIALMSIVYMLMAGIMSIQVLIKKNIIFGLSLTDRFNKDKKVVFKNTQLNICQNLIRNNMIYSAYCAIRNSVICLVIIFIMAILPLQGTRNSNNAYPNVNKYNDITFDTQAVEWIVDNNFPNVCWENIIDQITYEDNQYSTMTFYDENNEIIIIIEKKDDLYVVKNIHGNVKVIK